MAILNFFASYKNKTPVSFMRKLFRSDHLTVVWKAIKGAFEEINDSFECVFVDDASNDRSWEVLKNLKQEDPETNKTHSLWHENDNSLNNEGYLVSSAEQGHC